MCAAGEEEGEGRVAYSSAPACLSRLAISGRPFILANISVDFDDLITADEVEQNIAHIDRRIKQVYPQIKRVFVEAEKRSNHPPE